MILNRPDVQGSKTFRPLPGRILFFFLLLLPGGCFGTPPSPSNPGFMIVVNKTSTTGSGTQGLLEYTLPLSSGQGPLVTRTAHGIYAGGVIAQTFLFVFGTASGIPTLWRYNLPLSTAPAPTALQGFTGTPVAALSIANGQFVVFLEQNPTSGEACLQGFTFGSLVDATGPNLPSPSLDCTNATLPLDGPAIPAGGLQQSGNGSQVYVEASTSTQTEELTVSAGGLSSGSLQVVASHTLFSSALSGPFQGATESTTLLLLPDPTTPAVDFYAVTGLSQGGNLSPIATNGISVPDAPNLLAVDPFGTFLYAAVTSPSSSSVPAIQSFDISTLQSGPGPTAPFAQTGSGLHPAGLLTFTASQG
ncbi:MAG: hypothetical protein ACYCRD_05460 [Leptospirillum sp.]